MRGSGCSIVTPYITDKAYSPDYPRILSRAFRGRCSSNTHQALSTVKCDCDDELAVVGTILLIIVAWSITMRMLCFYIKYLSSL